MHQGAEISAGADSAVCGNGKIGIRKAGPSPPQTADKKLFSPFGGRIAFSANERVAEFLDFVIHAKFAYVNKMKRTESAFTSVKPAKRQNFAHACNFLYNTKSALS